MTVTEGRWIQAARAEDVEATGCRVVEIEGQTIALFAHAGEIHAVDNRCPHMGFPLSQGSVQCGILTCHWHHARFELKSGGTFDPWADDVRAYPVRIEDGCVWLDMSPPARPAVVRYQERLADGMRQNIRLIVAKATVGLAAAGAPDTVALAEGALFGARGSQQGWGSGLTILTAMANILPSLMPEDRPLALYRGLTHVAADCAGQPPAVTADPLPTSETRPEVFKTWFRQFVERRDRDGAERTLRTAIHIGLPMPVVADIIFSAATHHLYLAGGHALDSANKAFELLDHIGWPHAETILPSLTAGLTRGQRMEEASNWRHPIDLAALLQTAFDALPELWKRGQNGRTWDGRETLVETLLGDDPAIIVDALKSALAAGATAEQVADSVAFAAARRIAQFRTSNEYGDWITVLHTFTYANAVHQAMRRAPSPELLRGVFDAAMSVYLDRFLNTPPAPLPRSDSGGTPAPLLNALLDSMDRQQQVTEAAQSVSDWLASGGSEAELLATLGRALLREDAEFHTFQMVEAGFRQYADRRGTEDGRVLLVAVARYLAAHAPTPRASGQTYHIAQRLHRGEALYAD